MTLRPSTVLAFMGACLIGCTPPGDLRHSTEQASNMQLEAASRSGFQTELIVSEEAIDAEELMRRQSEPSEETTYLVLTRNDAQIVWSRALRDEPPASEGEILGRWVVPYVRSRDQDTALKAFVFGYLHAMHRAGHIDWNTAIVPFLPPHEPAPVRSTFPWGMPLAILIALIVAWSARARSSSLEIAQRP